MNLRRALFVFGGGGLIVAILAFRFGLFTKIASLAGQESRTAVRQPPPTGSTESAAKTTAGSDRSPETKSSADDSEAAVAAAVERAAKVSPEAMIQAIMTPPSSAEQTAGAKPEAIEVPGAEASAKPDPLGLGDPFSYSAIDADDFSPFGGNRQVGEISIKGIIHIQGEDPVTIVQLNDTGRSYYVKTGNVIRINTPSKTGNLVNEAYIIVKDVRDDEVELIQQERPDKVIIVR